MTEETALALRLGALIRESRRAQGLSLVQVAEATQLSHSFLSQLERGKTRASMRSLFAIANALGTTQESLLSAASVAPGEIPPIVHGQGGGELGQISGPATARLLMHTDSGVDITEFIDLPREHSEFFHHVRPEFIYVVSGVVEVQLREGLNGAITTMVLQARNSVLCQGNVHHRYRSLSGDNAVALMIHYPG